MDAYSRVQAARAKGRRTSMDYIQALFTDFVELHGDRRYAEDRAIVAGIARLDGRPVTVIGIEKGRDTQERLKRNFGMAHPEGYHKAIRHFRMAEKFKRPVICFVDTSGAYPGLGAEERGQGAAIAESIATLMGLKVPVISVIVGEGGSGGALALAAANEVWMLENAVYSVISPEGAASIIWKDAKRVKEASECLKLTAQDLMKLGVVERVFEEGDNASLNERLGRALADAVQKYSAMDASALTDQRYRKFRVIGGQAL
jgi:acetyl-CoA carboxylase carboxyl transferase subunit alpha